MRDTVCVCCGNQKGGVGKTTTAVHLGVALAERGLRVCICDLDPNHGATSHLGCPADLAGTLEWLVGEAPAEALIVRDRLPAGVHLLPASRALEGLDRELQARSDGYTQPWQCLQGPLRHLRTLRQYDVVILDTGPNANTPTRAAYAASDAFLAVVRPERPSAEGLATVISDLMAVRRPGLNPRLRFLGAVLTNVDRRNRLGSGYAEVYEEFFAQRGLPGRLFRAQIPTAVGFGLAWQARQTLFEYDPEHRALQAVRALAEEFLERLRGPATAEAGAPVAAAAAAAGRR